jgi:hypothetical protein
MFVIETLTNKGVACLRMTAMRNVMAGTEFCIADAKVGDVLSKPSK